MPLFVMFYLLVFVFIGVVLLARRRRDRSFDAEVARKVIRAQRVEGTMVVEECPDAAELHRRWLSADVCSRS